MRLMRFLDNKDKKIKYCTVENGSNFLIDGDIYSNYKVTKMKSEIRRSPAVAKPNTAVNNTFMGPPGSLV